MQARRRGPVVGPHEEPGDDAERIDPILEAADPVAVVDFLRTALARDPDLRDRFLARFGESSGESVGDYRETVDDPFDERAGPDGLVFEAVDFSRPEDLAAEYRDRGDYRTAATVYRGLARGIEENTNRVDGASDHFARAFHGALDDYADCVPAADLDPDGREAHVDFPRDRAENGLDYLRERYAAVITDLEGR